MRYKVGDKVRVRKDLKCGVHYKMEDGKFSDSFTPFMEKFRGKIVTIVSDSAKYMIDGDCHMWTDEMFEPVNDQKIVITSDGTETLARLYDGNKVVKTATAKCSPDDTFDFKTGAMLAFERLMNEVQNPLKFEIGKQYQHGDCVIKITSAKRTAHSVRYLYDVIEGDAGIIRFFDENSYFGKELKPYEPTKYYNGKVVCVERGYGTSIPLSGVFTIGKVYTVKDGVIVANFDYKTERYTTLDKLCEGVGHKFVPFVE